MACPMSSTSASCPGGTRTSSMPSRTRWARAWEALPAGCSRGLESAPEMPLRPFRSIRPRVHPSCFIAPSAELIGDVELAEGASVWFNSVVRGDVNPIRIGQRTNIQDLCMVHVLKDRYATAIGDDVTVGHHVVLHGCRVGSRVLVGM